jgi:hypothetical protein
MDLSEPKIAMQLLVPWQPVCMRPMGAGFLMVAVRKLKFPNNSSELQHADALTLAFTTPALIRLFHAFNVKSV